MTAALQAFVQASEEAAEGVGRAHADGLEAAAAQLEGGPLLVETPAAAAEPGRSLSGPFVVRWPLAVGCVRGLMEA